MYLRRTWCKKCTPSLHRVTRHFLPMGFHRTCLSASILSLVDIAIKSSRDIILIKLEVISTLEANARRKGSDSLRHVARSQVSENVTMIIKEIWHGSDLILCVSNLAVNTWRFTKDTSSILALNSLLPLNFSLAPPPRVSQLTPLQYLLLHPQHFTDLGSILLTRPNTRRKMRLVRVWEKAFRTDLWTDGRTNPLIEMLGASKNLNVDRVESR